VITQTYRWNKRKRMFPEEHIGLAWTTLAEKQWLDAQS
jgi:hypothetical protein